jgi:bifunctional non-homologous end joining protein LigD
MLAKFPFVLPCFPRLRSRPPAGKDWLHEVKFDGCRVQLHKVGSEVTIYSGHGAELTFCRASIAGAMTLVPTRSVIIDGELVGCEGRVNLEGLHAGAVDDSQFIVYCFDLLALNAKDLRSLPLLARKEKLADLLAHTNSDLLQYSDLFTDPKRLLAACEQDGLRGIVSKHADSLYRSGRGDWIKVRCRASANHVPRP